MKTARYVAIILILMIFRVSPATADIRETLTFTNFTDEELLIELSVNDTLGWITYDLYVLPDYSSVAYFWVDIPYAAYTACAYGVITDDFYGCYDGSVSDVYDEVYFDNTGEPYASTPSGLPAERYYFDNPHDGAVVVVDDGHSYFAVGCFITSLLN